MPRLSRLSNRNAQIYAEYKKIYTEKFLRHEKILHLLTDKYYLAPDTIEKIVLQQSKEVKNGK